MSPPPCYCFYPLLAPPPPPPPKFEESRGDTPRTPRQRGSAPLYSLLASAPPVGRNAIQFGLPIFRFPPCPPHPNKFGGRVRGKPPRTPRQRGSAPLYTPGAGATVGGRLPLYPRCPQAPGDSWIRSGILFASRSPVCGKRGRTLPNPDWAGCPL